LEVVNASGQTPQLIYQRDRFAATAEVHDLILVTRNTRDFEGCNIQILNPFVE